MKNYKYIISFNGEELETGEIKAENISEAREKVREELDLCLDIIPVEED
jgi:hypothetical protein